MKKRVVITGIGVLSCIGKGRQDYWHALRMGKGGVKKITLFDTSKFNVNYAGEITDFDPKQYLGAKGLRSLDRSTTLLVSASKLAINDSGFTITQDNADSVGVSIGSTLGSVRSIADFYQVTLQDGPRYTNPSLFPNTVINSPASQVSIWNNIRGFNTTISTGFTASLDAIKYAYDFIQLGRIKLVYAGGVEEMCAQTFLGFHVLKYLSGSQDGEKFLNCPFDRRRNGIMFGEGACLLAVEDRDHAVARNARILCEVIGFGTSFDPYRINKYNPRATGLKRAIKITIEESGLKPDDIDYICANANSTVQADKIETSAIKEIFGARAYRLSISAPKSMLGESFSAAGALSTSAAVGAIHEGFIPPTIDYKEEDPDCDLDYTPNKAKLSSIKNALVISASPGGESTCAILKRYE